MEEGEIMKKDIVSENHQKEIEKYYAEDGNFFKGLMWAVLLSIPLWVSIFGWIKIISSFFS